MSQVTGEDDKAIAISMQQVRERGHLNAYEFKLGMDRLSDWREHVRSHPLPAVTASVLAGFLVAQSVLPTTKPTVKVVRVAKGGNDVDENEVAAKAGAASAVAAIVGTMLTNAARQYVSYQIQNRFKTR